MVVTFDRDDLAGALGELTDELAAQGVSASILIVGGAALSLNFGRDGTTTDVDALYRSNPRVEAAVSAIAGHRGWPKTWLNDKMKGYMSHYETVDDWTVLLQREQVVRVANAQMLLAMKLHAARGRRDSGDIDLLLDECAITSVTEAQELFDRYYPEEILKERALGQLRARFD